MQPKNFFKTFFIILLFIKYTGLSKRQACKLKAGAPVLILFIFVIFLIDFYDII